MKTTFNKAAVIVGCTLLILPWLGCKQNNSGQAGAGVPPAPEITVASVEQREIVDWEELSGRTAPVEFVEVRPRVSGHIREVSFASGQLVKKGDILFVIDPRWYQAELDRREAELAMAQVRLDNAEREARRKTQLLENRAISKEEADGREARFAEARAGLLAAKAARDSARLDVEYTEIRAPIDGRVSRAFVTAGNYISGQAAVAAVLTTIVSVDPIYVYADMDENALVKFKVLRDSGQLNADKDGRVPAELRLGDAPETPHLGFVESLDNRVDPQSGSIVLRAEFANPGGRIMPGLFARLRLPASPKYSALLIDETAVGTDQARKFVLTITSTNTTAYRPVELGPVIGGKRVVRAGLNPGDRVVINGLARVRPGMPVVPRENHGTDPVTAAAAAPAEAAPR